MSPQASRVTVERVIRFLFESVQPQELDQLRPLFRNLVAADDGYARQRRCFWYIGQNRKTAFVVSSLTFWTHQKPDQQPRGVGMGSFRYPPGNERGTDDGIPQGHADRS